MRWENTVLPFFSKEQVITGSVQVVCQDCQGEAMKVVRAFYGAEVMLLCLTCGKVQEGSFYLPKSHNQTAIETDN